MTSARERSLHQIVGDAVDLLTKFSIPLYDNDRFGRPEQFGTAFFVRASQSHFLLSAAHVLDEARKTRVFYYATPTALRSLTGRVLTTGHPDERDHDPHSSLGQLTPAEFKQKLSTMSPEPAIS